MPRVLAEARSPVDMCLVEYDRSRGEDIFLSYVWDRREGPPTHRTGDGAPYMELIGSAPGRYTQHPFGLRLGTWLIREDLRAAELEDALRNRDMAVRERRSDEDTDVLDRTIQELSGVSAHDAVFRNRMPHHALLGQQGCGDLTMNYWNVACVQGPMASSAGSEPVLVALRDEPLEWRTYSCLVKWKACGASNGSLTIEQVQFRHPSQTRDANEIAWVRYRGRALPRARSIEFAVSNQQVIREGRLVPVGALCHQFGDIRHLIEMPNLNIARALHAGEAARPGGGFLPRLFFSRPQYDPVWFGEKAFLDDEGRNFLRAALGGPVLVGFPPGPDEALLRGGLVSAGYREISDPLAVLRPGEWRFIRQSQSVTQVEIYFRRNTYGWTMIGLSQDRTKLFCLATKGVPGRTGYRLEEAAELLRGAGAWDALLIDEGADTFHSLWDGNEWRDLVKRDRSRMRAVFLFATGGKERGPTSGPETGESIKETLK